MLQPIIQIDPLTYLFRHSFIRNGIIHLRTLEEIDAVLEYVGQPKLKNVLNTMLRLGTLHRTDFIAWGVEDIYDELGLGG